MLDPCIQLPRPGGGQDVGARPSVDFRRELMEWMPPPDGIAMCQSGVR